MARFYQVQIETIYLTSNGLAGGLAAKLRIEGVDQLLQTMTGVAIPAIGGGVVTQLVPWTSGKQFEIQVETHLYKAQWDDLLALINGSLEDDTSLTITATGDTGNFSLEAKPNPQNPFSSDAFENNRIYRPVFRFITV